MEIRIVLGDNADIGGMDLIVLNISKHEVCNKTYDRVLDCISQLERVGKDAKGKLSILFEYDDHPDEIWEIPEIRTWVAGLIEQAPHLFYFLTKLMDSHLYIVECLADINAIKPFATYSEALEHAKKTGILPEILLRVNLPHHWSNLIFHKTVEYTLRIGDDLDTINDILSGIPTLYKNL